MARDGQLNILTLVGHKNMGTTKIYTFLDESNEERTSTISKNKYYDEVEVIKVQHVFLLSLFFLNHWCGCLGRLAQLVEQRTENLIVPINISNLWHKTMYSNVQYSQKCTVNVQHLSQ